MEFEKIDAQTVHIWIGDYDSETDIEDTDYFRNYTDSFAEDFRWCIHDDKKSVHDLFYDITPWPVENFQLMETRKEKCPELKRASAWILLFGHSDKKEEFESKKSSNSLCYLGEFYISEPELDDGRHDPWV